MTQINVFLARLSGLLHLDVTYFLKGSIWLSLPTFINQLLGLLRSVAFVHLTSQAIYGQFGFILSLVGLFSILSLPGINTALAQTVARGNLGSLRDASRTRALWGTLTTLCVISVALYYLWVEKQTFLAKAIIIAGLFVPLTSATGCVLSYYQGRKQFDKVSQINVGILIFNTVSLIIVLWWQKGLIWLVIVQGGTQIIFYWLYYRKALKQSKDQPSDPEMVSYGRSLTGASFISTVATQLDRVILGFSADFVNVAIYAIAQILPNNLKELIKMIGSLVLPKIAEQPDKKIYSSQTKKLLIYLLVFNIVVVLGLMAITPWILNWLYTDDYSSARPFAQLLLLSLALSWPATFFRAALQARKQTQAIYRGNVIYGGLLIGTLLISVPFLGILGIIFSRIIARWGIVFYHWQAVTKL